MLKIDYLKKYAKTIKKHANPNNLCLMKIQHEIAKSIGYKNWQELIKEEKEEEFKPEESSLHFFYNWKTKESFELELPNKKENIKNEL